MKIEYEDFAGIAAEMLCEALMKINKYHIKVHEFGSIFDKDGKIDIIFSRRKANEYCDVKGSLSYDDTCCIKKDHTFFNNEMYHYFALFFKTSPIVYFVNSYNLNNYIKKIKKRAKSKNGEKFYTISIKDVLSIRNTLKLKNQPYWILDIVDIKRNKMTFDKFVKKHFDIAYEIKTLNSLSNDQQLKYINNHIRGICIKIVDDDVPS